MKYKVGDVLHIEKFEFRLRLRPRPRPRYRPHLRHNNTVGIITAVEKHKDIFDSDSTENDNGYIWLSQIDEREYYFYENEVEGKVLK
jgi:hypothetical protein